MTASCKRLHPSPSNILPPLAVLFSNRFLNVGPMELSPLAPVPAAIWAKGPCLRRATTCTIPCTSVKHGSRASPSVSSLAHALEPHDLRAWQCDVHVAHFGPPQPFAMLHTGACATPRLNPIVAGDRSWAIRGSGYDRRLFEHSQELRNESLVIHAFDIISFLCSSRSTCPEPKPESGSTHAPLPLLESSHMTVNQAVRHAILVKILVVIELDLSQKSEVSVSNSN
ncbi:hypothetical protein EDB92DRAFT_1648 [Lactarius akahatsu]|uniref:Uncharacterized protein n=1 Tax=Lactarius akahatsu TaxID=416441 RepID=A0AAD4LSG8_9AGAM|nr:hypothetical protein EDB92DRAFT_1648 [Lactarius akahatsu]